MIKIYNRFNEFVKQTANYKDLRVEKGINQSDLIFFTAPKQNAGLFEEEGYIETKQGKFVIKEKNVNIDMQVVGKYDLTDLNKWVESKAYITMNVIEMFEDLLDGTGWTSVYDDTKTPIKRTVTATNMSILDVIKKAIEIFNYEIEFDNINKIIYVANELGSDKGVYFHDELNLKRINIGSDSHDFATRLIPVGFNDMGIEFINEGKPYVENHSYSDKVQTIYWKDERYTVAENLKEDAIKKLEPLAKPRRAYSIDIANLAKLSKEEYSILDYNKGDTIELVNKDTNTKEKQRIIKLVHYPNNPLQDTVEIENRPRVFGQKDKDEFDNLKESFNITKASLELFEDSIVATVTEIQGTVADLNEGIEGLEENLQGQITDNTAEISVQANQIAGKVSQTEYDENYNLINENFSEVEMEMDNIRAGVQVGGGNNLIKNSVGYGELNFWNPINESNYRLGTSNFILNGISKHGYIFSDFEMEQELKLETNKDYTISGKLQKNTPAGIIVINLNDNQGLVHEVINLGTETYEGQFSLEFNSGENIDLKLNIKGLNLSTVEPAQLTDLFLVQGKNNEVWSQANGEIYTLNVKVDGEGVRVYDVGGKGYTVMSPEEFAGYYNDEKVFTVNKDITEVMGLLVKGQGVFIPPIKMVQNGDESLDIVWTGG